MKKFRVSLVALSTCLLASTPALASPDEAQAIPDWGLEAGLGLNTIAPYGNLRLNRNIGAGVSANLALQLGPALAMTAGPARFNALGTLGIKYSLIQAGWFQPFIGADLGAAFNPEPGLFGQLGLGSDFMFSPQWGLSLAVRSNLNLLNRSLLMGSLAFRPELNLVWRF